MLSSITRSTLVNVARRMTVRSVSAEAASTSASTVKLNFTLPHEKIYVNAAVHSVIIPGSAGEYGVTANHVPYVAELKPGVLQILHEENSSEPEKYFVPGGFALTHADSSTVRCKRVRVLGQYIHSNLSHACSISCRTWFAQKRSNWTILTPLPCPSSLTRPRVPLRPPRRARSSRQKPRLIWKLRKPWEWPLAYH
jgi:hypothetical protein